MSSFVNADFASDSDSDDGDFDPTKELGHEAVSEEENSGDEENPGANASKRSKKGKKSDSKRNAGCFQFESSNDKESETMKEEFKKEKEELEQIATQKKNDDIWTDFLKDVGPVKKAKKSGGSSGAGGGLGAISSLSKPKKYPENNSKAKSKTKSVVKSSIDSLFDTIESGNKIEKVEEIKDDAANDTSNPKGGLPKSLMSSIFASAKTKPPTKEEADDITNEKSVQNSKNDDQDSGKMKITKVFDFAGEAVEVTKEVEKDSKEAKQFIKQQEKISSNEAAQPSSTLTIGQKRPGGLGSIMGVISGKTPKMGTLDKSKMDWNKFVDEEGIKEDLQSHNRGKDGYVEKQMFLERSDHRRFEIEKAAREKSRKNLTNN